MTYSLKERLQQQLERRRKPATPRRIAEQIGREEITSMRRGLELYPLTKRAIEEKRAGSKK